MDGYDTQRVCLNGHQIDIAIHRFPSLIKEYCPECGAKTIIKCPSCQEEILGKYFVDGVLDFEGTSVPKFCHKCGAAYPWTAAKIEAAQELVRETEGLSKDDVKMFEESISQLTTDSPKTPVAIVRFNKYAAKAGKAIAGGLRDLLVDIVSESVKKAIWKDQ